MPDRNIILTINTVEPALVKAVHTLSKKLGKELEGLVLVHTDYADFEARPKDDSGLFKEIICDFDNPDELQRVLKPYTDSLLIVTCRYEDAMHRFRQVVPFVPYVNTPSESSLLWSTEKPLMRDRLSNYDKSLTPLYQHLKEVDMPQLEELIKDFTYPLIVKPSDLQDALLVTECHNLEELKVCLSHTFQVIHEVYSRKHRHFTPSVLVEEMMQGKMYSTDAYVMPDGEIFCLPLVEVITAHSLGLPGFYSYRILVPTDLPETESEAAFEASKGAIKALNLRSTTTHIELFQTPQGWKIIELGARIGGYREAMYREAYGIEHFYNDLAVRIGIKPTMPSKLLAHVFAINIYADQEGEITAIEGLEEAEKLESTVSLVCKGKPGDVALFANNGGGLIIDGILSNKNLEQLEKDDTKLRELIKIKVKPPARK
ncbi:MAG TPA: ATP-grasp domain-containing protein, partial [Candidatus Dormibacteraeota bacterium]|nr:ATP-grasp domain-containing protein [Candidatus Dormibacteraeota bacterium]